MNKYKWEVINFPSEKDDKKKFDKNNPKITFNVQYMKNEKIYPAYVSKNNSNREKSNYCFNNAKREKWHYPAVRKLSALLRGITAIDNSKK